MTTLEQHLSTINSNSNIPNSTAGNANHQGIAFFDLDRTLISGFSILAMGLETARFAMQQGELKKSAKVIRDTLKHKVGSSGNSYDRLVRRLAKSLKGVSENTLNTLGARAYESTLAKSIYREAIALVEAHRAAGHKLVIVSAASTYQVEPIAKVLGFDEICCTQLEVTNGRFTGKTIVPLCFGEGKTMAAQRIAHKYKTSLEHAWFYSDSKDDIPLLSKVGHPVATNPSENLSQYAQQQGWPQLRFTTRGMPGVESLIRTTLTLEALMATTAWGMISKRLGVEQTRTANQLTRLVGDVGCSCAGLNFDIEGGEYLEKQRPAIFVFNHQSMMDTLVLAHLLRHDAVAYCKTEMDRVPVIGPLLRQAETIFVDRADNNQKEVLRKSLEVLRNGRSLVIAPEGTRSTLGDIQPFKQGAFFLAKKAKVPIIPIVLHNVKDAMPKGGLLIRPANIKVTVLPPLLPEDMTSIRETCVDLENRYIELLGHSKQACLPQTLKAPHKAA